MTVKQLIAKLQNMEGGRIVVLQKDGEGNGYSPLVDLGHAIYRADSTWSGEIVDITSDDYEKQANDRKAVVLVPVN